MYHYTYEITYTNNTKYIGVRSCKCLPEKDTNYIGSSKYTPNTKVAYKLILSLHKSRVEALSHECYLQRYNDVVRNPVYHNRSIQTSTGFDTTGLKLVLTKEHKAKIGKASTGRIKSPETCAKISASKKGKSNGPRSETAKLAISKANLGKTFQGRSYSKEAYTSRLKFTKKYMWVNTKTLEHLFLTPQELGHKLGFKVARLNKVIKGISYSCMNWSLVHLFVHKHHK